MKKLFLIILFSVSLKAIAQPNYKNIYKVKFVIEVKECDIKGKVKDKVDFVQIPEGFQFKITPPLEAADGYVMTFIRWTEDSGDPNLQSTTNFINNVTFRGSHSNDVTKYYFIPKAMFDSRCEERFHTATWGLTTDVTIIKIRPGSSKLLQGKYPIYTEVTNNINIGMMLVGKFSGENSPISHYIQAGFSFGLIPVTPQSTQDIRTTDGTVGAITPTIGYTFEVNKAQVSVTGGIDYLTGPENKTWVYRGRPWIGLGIGFSLVSLSSPTPKSSTQP
ncbi:hypothetical protein SAMN05192574_105353 [Mucilaginibacter gossypiicola]|uniref:Outer membrane protein beta-barrel domain-containing protein n=1 Tax=Mucilaginibacter gossypiicola TaxID=551995 RepID=A0A1H8M2J9_9SPHI|nr:hypothetical protein [Mucilaginibacter gossypiicola]SEO11378.1 hypothetical protein SAMN05192574_105353 [Mucilaginibacter gossypiicola]